mgnify:CR=1 FL=1
MVYFSCLSDHKQRFQRSSSSNSSNSRELLTGLTRGDDGATNGLGINIPPNVSGGGDSDSINVVTPSPRDLLPDVLLESIENLYLKKALEEVTVKGINNGVTIKERYLHNTTTIAHLAVAEANNEMLLRAINALGAYWYINDRWGSLPSHIAASKGDMATLRVLKDLGVDLNQISRSGKTVAHVVVSKGHASMIRELKEELGVNFFFNDGEPGLVHMAILSRNTDLLDDLYSLGPDAVNFEQRNLRKDGSITPIQYAVKNGNIEAVRKLMRYGANVNVTDRYRNTLVHIAAKESRADMIEALSKVDTEWLKARNINGDTPLEMIIKSISCRDPEDNGRRVECIRVLGKLMGKDHVNTINPRTRHSAAYHFCEAVFDALRNDGRKYTQTLDYTLVHDLEDDYWTSLRDVLNEIEVDWNNLDTKGSTATDVMLEKYGKRPYQEGKRHYIPVAVYLKVPLWLEGVDQSPTAQDEDATRTVGKNLRDRVSRFLYQLWH